MHRFFTDTSNPFGEKRKKKSDDRRFRCFHLEVGGKVCETTTSSPLKGGSCDCFSHLAQINRIGPLGSCGVGGNWGASPTVDHPHIVLGPSPHLSTSLRPRRSPSPSRSPPQAPFATPSQPPRNRLRSGHNVALEKADGLGVADELQAATLIVPTSTRGSVRVHRCVRAVRSRPRWGKKRRQVMGQKSSRGFRL